MMRRETAKSVQVLKIYRDRAIVLLHVSKSRLYSLTAIVIVIVNLCDSATSFGMMTIMSAQESL